MLNARIVYEISPTLVLDRWCTRELQRLVEKQGFLIWEREGEYRRVSNHLLGGVLAAQEGWCAWQKRRPNVDIPRDIGLIHWNQAKTMLHPDLAKVCHVEPLDMKVL